MVNNPLRFFVACGVPWVYVNSLGAIYFLGLSPEVLMSSFGGLGIALSFMLFLLQFMHLPWVCWRRISSRITWDGDAYREN